MRGKSGITMVLLMASAVLLSSCRDYRRIGVKTMADIYADMLVADQWVNSNPEYRRTADTTMFYGSIFARYGYTFRDYDESVKYYLLNPEKYQKITDLTYDKISGQFKLVEEMKKRMDFINMAIAGAPEHEIPVFALDSATRARFFETRWFHRDSIAPDSLSLSADSLAVQLDSLAAGADSLLAPKTDSIAAAGTAPAPYRISRDSIKLDDADLMPEREQIRREVRHKKSGRP